MNMTQLTTMVPFVKTMDSIVRGFNHSLARKRFAITGSIPYPLGNLKPRTAQKMYAHAAIMF